MKQHRNQIGDLNLYLQNLSDSEQIIKSDLIVSFHNFNNDLNIKEKDILFDENNTIVIRLKEKKYEIYSLH